MTTLTTHPVPAAPPPWSDVADAIWRRSLAEQHAEQVAREARRRVRTRRA